MQEQGSHGQDEGVLKSVLEDIRAWRVSSTLVDDPHEGQELVPVSRIQTSSLCTIPLSSRRLDKWCEFRHR